MAREVATRPLANRLRTPARIGAVVLPLVTCALLAGFRESVTNETAVLLLVLWVVAAAASGDRVAGVLAALSGGLWFDFFLTQPYLRFTIDDPDDVEATALLLLIGLLVTEVALWGHRQHAQASRRSGYLEGVLGTARTVAEGDVPVDALIAVVAREITEVLGAETCRYRAGPVHDARIAVMDHDGVVTRGDHAVDVDRTGLPTNEHVALLVRRGTQVMGHFLVSTPTRVTFPSREQRRVAVLLADQVAAAVGAR
jgi:K+-sensing histidine kinase KdpD